jgi:hypothetical protein
MGTSQLVGRSGPPEGIRLRVYYAAVKAEMESAQPPVSDENKRRKERHAYLKPVERRSYGQVTRGAEPQTTPFPPGPFIFKFFLHV